MNGEHQWLISQKRQYWIEPEISLLQMDYVWITTSDGLKNVVYGPDLPEWLSYTRLIEGSDVSWPVEQVKKWSSLLPGQHQANVNVLRQGICQTDAVLPKCKRKKGHFHQPALLNSQTHYSDN
jgi:hypothetical protein